MLNRIHTPCRPWSTPTWLAIAFTWLLSHATAAPLPAHQAADASRPPAERALPAAEEPEDETPEDPLHRGTPRGTVEGFLTAARAHQWSAAAQFLDLTARPEAVRAEEGAALARQLKFVLDQKLWIDLDAVSAEPRGEPGDARGSRRDVLGRIASERGEVEIALARVPRAPDGALIWLFGSGTIARVPELYDSFGVAPLLDRLPRSLTESHFLELATWQWIGVVVLVLIAWLGAWILSLVVVRIVKPWTMKSQTDIDDRLLDLVVGPLRLLCSIGILNATLHLLLLTIPARTFARETSKFLVIAGITWLAFRVIDLAAGIVRERLTRHGRAGAVNLVPLGTRAIKVAIGSLSVLAALDTFGFDVTAVLAGLGVGGLAVALAAQKTIENVFGGVSVLVDQPIRPGDFCKFGDQVGTVEDIGIRSTRIRTLDRTVITVPNSTFSNFNLENFAKRDRIRLITTLGLRYETTADQLRHVLDGLRRILLAHPRIASDPQRVRFVGFGAFSLDLELFAYVETTDYNEFLAVREDIFLRVMRAVADSGTGFAFPSSTTYLARDTGLDAERTRAAEEEVGRWRTEGRLPFPNPAAGDVRELAGSLDWPPTGSVGRASG